MTKNLIVSAACLLVLSCGTPAKPAADPCAPGTTVSTQSAELDYRTCAARTKESPAVNLLVDSVWWALNDDHFSADVTAKVKAKSVKFFIDNSGGAQFKAAVAAGPICSVGYPKRANNADDDTKTYHEAVLPFYNSVVLVTMTRDKLRQVLERSFADNVGTTVNYPNEDGSFLVPSSNVVITVNFADYANKAAQVGGNADRKERPTTRDGSLIESMTVDGQPFALTGSDTVTVAMSSFVAGLDINADSNTLKGTAFKGGGYATGFISDYITDDKAPASSFEILTTGGATNSADTISHTSALGKYIAATKTISPEVTGRYVYKNVDQLTTTQQSKLANPCQ